MLSELVVFSLQKEKYCARLIYVHTIVNTHNDKFYILIDEVSTSCDMLHLSLDECKVGKAVRSSSRRNPRTTRLLCGVK